MFLHSDTKTSCCRVQKGNRRLPKRKSHLPFLCMFKVHLTPKYNCTLNKSLYFVKLDFSKDNMQKGNIVNCNINLLYIFKKKTPLN